MSGFSVTKMTHYSEAPAGHFAKSIEISLTSCGPVTILPASQLDNLFLNANDLSIDELLKLAYQKIDAREQVEEELSRPTSQTRKTGSLPQEPV
jgi:hypothetical protein